MNIITIKSVSTADVEIAQKALESIGFHTIREGDACDGYWISLEVPDEFFDNFPEFKINYK